MATFTKRDYYNKLIGNNPNPNPTFRGMDYDEFVRRNGLTDQYFSHTYFDDDYLSEIARFKDKPYYNNLLNNPWLAGNQAEFSPNMWQIIGENMNDFSARDSYNAQLQQQRSQWLSEKLAQYEQQDYDSAQSQVERERIAGLNPDLNGNITPGNSAENDQPSGLVEQSSESAVSDIFSLGNTILSTAMQFYSSFQSIRGASIDNRIKSLSLTDNLKSATWTAIREGFSEFVDASPGQDSSPFDSKGYIRSEFADSIRNRIKRLPYSNSNKRSMYRMVDDLIYSHHSDNVYSPSVEFEKLRNDVLSSLSKSRNEFTKSYGLPGGQYYDTRELRMISSTIYKPINDLALQVDKLLLQHKKQYESRAVSIGLGSQQASAESSGYRMKSDLFNIKNKIVKSFQDINKRITGSKDISPTWKLALEAGVSSAEALILNKLSIQ